MQDGFWVFGYGSLIWRTGFPYRARQLATLQGYRRRFCMESHHYRGTPALPGLVLALDPLTGASCRGLAFHVDPADADEVMAYLRGRELISDAYREVVHEIEFGDGVQVSAVCYVMNQAHHQYRGGLSVLEQAEMIARASGSAGANTEYLFNTFASLRELGIEDAELAELVELVKGFERLPSGSGSI